MCHRTRGIFDLVHEWVIYLIDKMRNALQCMRNWILNWMSVKIFSKMDVESVKYISPEMWFHTLSGLPADKALQTYWKEKYDGQRSQWLTFNRIFLEWSSEKWKPQFWWSNQNRWNHETAHQLYEFYNFPDHSKSVIKSEMDAKRILKKLAKNIIRYYEFSYELTCYDIRNEIDYFQIGSTKDFLDGYTIYTDKKRWANDWKMKTDVEFMQNIFI